MLEDAIAFAGVSQYPARIKCALLGWMAWKDATARAVGDARDDGGERMSETATQTGSGGPGIATVEDVEEAMRDVVDPELGINVVDLGLVYGVHVDDDNVAPWT